MAKLNYSIALNLLTNGVNEGAKKVEGIFQKMKASITNTLGTIGVGLGIGTITTSMIEQSKEFQEQMAHIKGSANATSGEIKNMQDVALKMGATTNYSATEAAQSMEQMTTNGISATGATKILGTTLEFAEARAIDTSKAADILTQQMKAFGMAVTEANAKKVSDVLSFAAPKVGGIDKLTESLREVAPVAKTAGIGIEDTVSAVTGLMQAGMESTQAGTTVMQLITRLSAQTPQAAKVFKQFGVDINAATLKADGLSGILKKLAQSGIGNNSSALATVFGKRAYAGAETLIANYQKVMQLNGELQKSNGTTARQAEDNAQTVEGTIKGIKALWDTSLVDIGKSVNGPLAGILHAVRSLLTSIASDMTGFIIKIGVIFASIKGWKIFSGLRANFAESSAKIVQDAISMNGKLATLKRKEVALEKTLDKENTEFFNSSCDQIDAIQLKRNQTIAQLEENRTAQEKLQAEARVATERAAAVQTGSTWQALQVKLQMGAEKVGAAFKAMWSTAGPMVILTIVTELISKIIDLYQEHVRINKITEEYKNNLKEAEQEYSPQISQLEVLKKQLNDNKLTVAQHRNIVSQINNLLGTQITNEKDLNKVLNDRIGILKQSADVQFYEQDKIASKRRLKEIEDKWKGNPNKKNHRFDKFFSLDAATGKYSYWAHQNDKNEYNNLQRNLKEDESGITNAANAGRLVSQDESFGNRGGNGPVDARTIDTSTHHHKETAAEKAAKAAAEELANITHGYSASLTKLTWQYKNGYIKESEYLSQLKDLTDNTYMETQTSKYMLARKSKLANELGNAVKTQPSQDFIEFKKIQEQLTDDLKKLDRQIASGAISWDDYFKQKHDTYLTAFKNSSALNLTENQKKISGTYRENAIPYKGAMIVNDHERDTRFDYNLSKSEILQADLDDAERKLKIYTEANKDGLHQFDAQINSLNLEKLNLGNALDVEKFKKDIRDAKVELEDNVYSIIDNIGGIDDAWRNVEETFKNSNKNVFEKALATFRAIHQSIKATEGALQAIGKIENLINKLKGAEKGIKAIGDISSGKSKEKKGNSGAIGKVAGVVASKLVTKETEKNTKALTKEAAAAKADADATMKLAASKFFLAEASKGLPGAALAAAATTIMIASVKAAKPFAHGGIVHGKPFDGSIARVSDGEMIVNSYQQQKLWNAISSGNLGGNNQAGGEVTFTIKGHDLQGVLDNYNRKMGRVR